MAGGYQTAGESARRGTNIRPDTGGGWMNGRGDDTQTMFLGYGHIVEFFTGFEWWKSNPRDELVNSGNYCLADPGHVYAIYLPRGGKATLHLEAGKYHAEWFNATSGQRYPIKEDVAGPSWTSPEPPDENGSPDWAILLHLHVTPGLARGPAPSSYIFRANRRASRPPKPSRHHV